MAQRHVVALAPAWVILAVGGPLCAQDETLSHDDGTPAGVYSGMSAGDAELVAFRPPHPCRVTAVRLWFTGTPVETTVYVWEDWGEAGFPDWSGTPLFEATVTPAVDEWTVVDLSGVVIDPPRSFLVGHVIVDDALHLAADGSAPAEGEERSLLYIDGGYYVAGDSDLMVRSDVEYLETVDTPSFTDVGVTAGWGDLSPRRVAWGDYDGDGDDDLLVNGATLLANDGHGTFTDVSEEADLRDETGGIVCGGSGGVWADYDNDGHLDFYSISHGFVPGCDPEGDGDWYCNHFSGGAIPECRDGYCRNEGDPWPAHDCLWHNDGDGTFTVVDGEGAPFDYSPTEGAAWGDYDNDGFVDLYVANYEMPASWIGEGHLGEGTPDILWRNRGDGSFEDVSETALDGTCRLGAGRGVNWGDFDDDGLIDVFVSVYRLQPNCLWRNRGDGSFEEVAEQAGVRGEKVGSSWGHTIGSQWWDFDNDGDLDLFSANLAHPRFIEFSDKSMLLIGSGAPAFTFEDEWAERGFVYQETDSEPAWADFDNDGLSDIYITDVYEGRLSELYRQRDDGTFEDVTYETGTAVDNGWGAAWADMDGDGDLDLATRTLLRNDGDHGGHWLKVSLEGTVSNRAAIGARVRVRCDATTFTRQVEGGKGTTNQDSLTLHFGLGACTRISLLEVRWPSGLVSEMTEVDVDRTVSLVEGEETAADEDPEEAADVPPDGSTDAGSGPAGASGGCGCSLVG